MPRRRIYVAAALGLGMVLIGGLITIALTSPRKPKNPPKTLIFHGLVIDENEDPVAGATVVLDFRSGNKERSPEIREVVTGADGRFSTEIRDTLFMLVKDVRKNGYQWVIDLAWESPYKNTTMTDNRVYLFGLGGTVYQPDSSAPAIFPLHRPGANVVGRTSRGGSDKTSAGEIVRYDRHTPRIPSTGPGAPRDTAERVRMLEQLPIETPPQSSNR